MFVWYYYIIMIEQAIGSVSLVIKDVALASLWQLE